MESLTELFIQILMESLLITGILGYIFTRREERMKRTIEEEFRKRDRFFESQFDFKLRSLEELLAPVKLQLIRSQLALRGYTPNNAYRENILKECNERIMGLLLERGHLIPEDLLDHAQDFIRHFDNWLQEYRRVREDQHDENKRLVFTHDFPKAAETAFLAKFDAYKEELKMEEKLR